MRRWIEPLLLALLISGCAGPTTLPDAPPGSDSSNDVRIPLDPTAQQAFERALNALQNEAYTQSIEGFQALTLSHPAYRGPWINLAIAWGRKGDIERARGLFRDMVSRHPDWAMAHHELAILQRQAGEFAAARRSYEAAIVAQPDFALAYRNLGLLCDLYLHDINCALSKYEKYQALLEVEDKEVALWIADAKRRLAKDGE